MLWIAVFWIAASVGYAAETLPADWKSWTSMTTPLATIGALPGCSADVSKLPPIYQKTVQTYCNVKPEGPGKVDILVKPDAVDTYKARTGKFKDGPTMILHLKDLKALFLTSYKNGAPVYSVHKEDGTDITAPSGAMSSAACVECHTGYAAFCTNGQCGTFKGK
jgi:hypothetical protein